MRGARLGTASLTRPSQDWPALGHVMQKQLIRSAAHSPPRHPNPRRHRRRSWRDAPHTRPNTAARCRFTCRQRAQRSPASQDDHVLGRSPQPDTNQATSTSASTWRQSFCTRRRNSRPQLSSWSRTPAACSAISSSADWVSQTSFPPVRPAPHCPSSTVHDSNSRERHHHPLHQHSKLTPLRPTGEHPFDRILNPLGALRQSAS